MKADDALAAKALAKLKECKLDTGAPSDPSDEKVEDEYDRCAATCVIDGACSELKELRCSDSLSRLNPVVVCLSKCTQTPSDGFVCDDNAKVPHAALCDGSSDCAGGEDEASCGAHTCTDGEQLTISNVKCDGFADCSDASDEDGCPDIFS